MYNVYIYIVQWPQTTVACRWQRQQIIPLTRMFWPFWCRLLFIVLISFYIAVEHIYMSHVYIYRQIHATPRAVLIAVQVYFLPI
uniref:Uncharacterized protein n=1 Tax=Trichogramma kaykai TaxID=54128 RepID=A0ABD2XFQ7_9HYME